VSTARIAAALLLALHAPMLPAQHAGADGAARPDSAAASARADSISADSALDVHTTRLAVQLRCAVCQGISIQESPSALAREMRELVKEQLRAGRTDAEVKAYFVSKYGEWILLAPKAQGFNLLLYLAPFVLLVGGFVGIAVVVKRWTAAAPPDAGAP
jgi:cytochrome c-type biogenesis protein CcmH